ncbi:SdrD B-like domain-containing protein [Lacrimispora sp.]|uniref:SdrD B-like domain-containing protein n=1 Tax=Lacrimispora sp. TaxID=2719234 RepID=UPI0028A11868|nr:SdrD B-like domain-containing protein [Lacrimispora sp.]
MATVSGRIIFDRNRSATIDAGDSGIANVPVVLQNITTGARLVVLTDAAGNYAFINVPNGSYRIVEAYGTAGGVATPGDFTLATPGPVPTAATPPISFVANPPTGSTNLDCLTPNTIFITVTGADVTNQNILNGPVIYTPIATILDPCTTVSNTNLITDAENGTFGFFPPGTPANTGPAVAPYPNVTPDFTYVVPDPTKFTPIDGEYTVQNIMTDAMSNVIGAWWRIADHTTGNETGRMMVVNGFNPGAVFFRSTVPVTPNTNFLFSTWILNLFKVTGFPPAQLGVRILDQNGNVLFQQALGVEIPVNTNAPEWKQIGTVINSMNNTQITVEFFSEGEAVVGNDYAIDDVALQEILVPIFTPVKSGSTFTANVGDIVTYTVKLTNTCTSPLTDVFFEDNIPNGLLFIPESVTVNGVPEPGVDPNIGFPLPDIPGGSVTEVTFQVRVEGIPNPNPAINTATINYSYTPVEGGIPGAFSEESNPVPLMVEELPVEADIAVVKQSNQVIAVPGEPFSYTITVNNFGPSASENVLLMDSIPSSILSPMYSIDGGVTFNPWPGFLSLGTLPAGAERIIIIRGTVSPDATGVISNTAVVSSTTPDPNPENNTSTLETPVSAVEADIAVEKQSNQAVASPGEPFSYTIIVNNFGPNAAENVLLMDSIPSSILNPVYSIDGGVTFNPWPGFLNLGTLPVGAERVIIIRGTVSPDATGVISNTAIVSSTTPDPNPENNTSTLETPVSAVEADIAVEKQSNQAIAIPGEPLNYTIVVENFGPNAAEDVLLMDSIPNSILNPEYSIDGGITFNPWPGFLDLGTLLAGAERIIIIRGTVSPTAAGIIINTATVSSPTPDPNPENNTSTTETPILTPARADVSITKTARPNPVAPGEMITFTLVVSNAGPNTAENVIVNDNISPSITEPVFSIDGGATFNPWLGSLNIGALPAGESRTIIIRGTVAESASGCINNTAIAISATPDPNLFNNVASLCVAVAAGEETEADVSVKKFANKKEACRGELVEFTIVVSNAGPADAQNVVLTDSLANILKKPMFSLDDGFAFQPWPGSVNLGTIPAGTSRVVLIKGCIRQTCSCKIINTAQVSSTTPDPDLNNNTSTACILILKCCDD